MSTRLFALSRFLTASCLTVIADVATPAIADVRLPNVLGSHMVLQRDQPITVWGWATPGESVRVELAADQASTTADGNGEWKVLLPLRPASSMPVSLIVSGSNTIKIDDLLVGDVWLCSGQSNMQYGLGNVTNAKQEIAAANEPLIRILKISKVWSPQPQSDVIDQWKVCTPTSVAENGWNGFSAIGYYFGRDLQRQLKVPIGLIDSTHGGSKIQSWTPPEGFAAVPTVASELKASPSFGKDSPERIAQLTNAITRIEEWTSRANQALAARAAVPAPPALPAELFNPGNPQDPTALFNGMIRPLCPVGLRGVIWYQGEANSTDGAIYTDRMKALISGWRQIWDKPELPFYFVQIAPFAYSGSSDQIAEFWQAQAAAERDIAHTGMVVINDLGDPKNIHPKNKADVAHRLSSRALTDTYGRPDICSRSPKLTTAFVQGDVVQLTFTDTGTGLKTRDGQPPTWFEIAGNDGKFHLAAATVKGDSVRLSAPSVPRPTAVRFAWDKLAEPNLVNSAGLPASAFRTNTPFAGSIMTRQTN